MTYYVTGWTGRVRSGKHFPRRGLKYGTRYGGGPASRYAGMRSRHTGFRRARRTFRPGYARTAGYFGRFTGRGAIEHKFHDLNITDASIAQGGTIIQDSCNLIAQGVTEVTRIGRKCTIKGINWRFNISLDTTTNMDTARETIRIILYLDKQANGVTAATGNILETSNYQSFNNLANKSRFRTLMDRSYDLNALGGAGDGTSNDTMGREISDSFYKKCTIPIEFDAVGGVMTAIKSNNIGVLILAKNGAVAVFESKMRLRFTDH